MNTQLLTPEERDRQARAYEEQARRLRQESINVEIGPEQPATSPEDKKSRSMSKGIINWSFIIFGIMGVIGSFWSVFDMIKYVSFLQTFAWIWAPLVIAVGSGRQVKHFIDKKYSDNQQNNQQRPPGV